MPRPSTDTGSQARKSNRLIHETSPYLQQHAWNPVDWYPWGDEALERARRENRMIFLSIGYSSCHWCHVMERESFENPEVARLLNEHFIAIKVDREERPDVDAVYMEALQMMTGQGGWPLNVWLTPDQIPIFAGTYFPPQDIHGRPGFASVLRELVDVYRNQPEKVKQQSTAIQQALQNDLYDQLSSEKFTSKHLEQAYRGYENAYDKKYGGFSGAPKFPTAMGIGFLLRYGKNPGAKHAHKMALHSLEKMICGGIYDQIGGGFHRYSTDQEWLVPHFEKMLYDNALLLTVLAEASLASGRTLFSEAADETIAFLNRDMRHPDGGYYSALDADTDGVEGAFYVFTDDELKRILDEDSFSLAADYFGVGPAGNWEGVSVLHRAMSLHDLAEKHEIEEGSLNIRLDRIKKQLLDYRNGRTRPCLDDKIITSWNALMLIAHCRCVRLLDRDSSDAVQLGTFLAERALQNGELYRIIDRNGNVKQPGFLDDYALLADSFSRLFEVTGDQKWLSLAACLTHSLTERFYDRDKNAFRYTSQDQKSLISKPRDLFDNAQPGGTSAAITTLFRTGHLCGMPEWTRIAIGAMEPLAQIAATHATAFGYLLQTMHNYLFPGKEIVIASQNPDTDPVAQKMIAIWRENYDPSSYLITRTSNRTGRESSESISKLEPESEPTSEMNSDSDSDSDSSSKSESKSESTPISEMESEPDREDQKFSLSDTGFSTLYSDKTTRDGKTTAWICRNFSCRQPVHDPDDFRKEISLSN